MRNPLVSFLARHCLAGVIAGWTTAALLLWLDVARLGTLVFASEIWPVPVAMLLTGFAVTFGGVAMAGAVMSLGRTRDDDAGFSARLGPRDAPGLATVRVRSAGR